MRSFFYPVFLRVEGRVVCVVGGGGVAERKVCSLLEAGARVRLVSPETTETLRRLAEEGSIEWIPTPFEPSLLEGSVLVFAATDNRRVNAHIAELASQRNLWVNVADSLEESSFVVPATVRRGDLQIAVSTGGSSPLLGRRIREELESRYGEEYEVFCDLLAEARTLAKQTLFSQQEREAFFSALMDSSFLELLREGNLDEARRRVLQMVEVYRRG